MLDAIQGDGRIRSYVSRRTQLGRHHYQGPTYYRQPVIKASPWTRKVPAYVFVAGVAGAAQIIATLARLGDSPQQRSIVRNGRVLGFAGSLLGAPLLIADLKTPSRFLNMLRIFRITSPMSIGSFILTGFGALSTATIAGEVVSGDTAAGRALQTASALAHLPAAIAGAGMATYTGALLSATSNPLWASAPRLISAHFGSSAMASGAAVLSLGEQMTGDKNGNGKTLDSIAMLSTAATLLLTIAADRKYKNEGVDAPLRHSLQGYMHTYGSTVLGQIAPLALYGVNAMGRKRSRGISLFASIAVLAGGAIMRQSIMQAEKTSAKRPEDYFSFTRFERLPSGERAQPAPPRPRRMETQHTWKPESAP